MFRGNTLSKLIVIALICIIFFMIYLKNYITAVISGLLLFVVFNDRRKRGQSDLKINNRVAEAMASKIKFEAEQHRKSRAIAEFARIRPTTQNTRISNPPAFPVACVVATKIAIWVGVSTPIPCNTPTPIAVGLLRDS